jgi:hypothetical protein
LEFKLQLVSRQISQSLNFNGQKKLHAASTALSFAHEHRHKIAAHALPGE